MENVKVKKVIPQDNLLLLVEFTNGIKKQYDVGQLFKQFPEYKILEHRPLFDTVQVECGGCAIAWSSDIDISEWELWDNGIEMKH